MRRTVLATLGSALIALLALPAGAQVSEETLRSISTPDKVETRLGTLEFKDGAPSKATLDKAYDHIDFTHAYNVFVNTLSGVSIHAARKGLLSAGVKDNEVIVFSDLMDAKSLFLTANADTVYAMGVLDLTKGPMVLEVPPKFIALKRMMAAMIELFCDSFEDVPRRIVLDIDDTEDRVHGGQQLSLFHAHYDSRCFLPIHIYEATSGKPVAVILRPGKTPGGAEVALVLRHVVKAFRRRWPRVDIRIRGDSHYARHEAMIWCEHNRVGYVFGLAGNQVLLGKVAALAEDAALGRVIGEGEKVRRFGEFRYAAKSWKVERRVIGRVEASSQGSDSRFVITNLAGTPRWLYESVYCARGQAENLIKAHKLHLASDRTSCTSATANQFRLLIHTAAYWLLHTLRGLAPKTSFWRAAQFDTIRLALIKVAARVVEMVTRIKVALPSCYPHQTSWARLAARATALPP